jgi:hypothetical protein
MREATARRYVESFRQRHGNPHLDLACHAALPLALSPDLAYLVWANFQRDASGTPLGIPWVAVADLLLSPLCEEVGDELYEMDEAVRSVLLERLAADDRFGPDRLRQIADFLDRYVEQQLNSDDIDVRDFAQAQHWAALAYTAPGAAANELARTISAVLTDKSEVVRIGSIVEALAAQLEPSSPTLLLYAQAAQSAARGRDHPALRELQSLAGSDNQVEVAGVSIPVPSSASPDPGPASPGLVSGIPVPAADPLLLGVHAAIGVPGWPQVALPAYVPRDIDSEVRDRVAAAAQRGGFVVLVGGSCVGKTRCAFEAVRALLPEWRLVLPAGTSEVTALADAPPARTVVWLDDLQRYLGGERGLTAAAVRALLSAASPVVIIGTLWPEAYSAYTATPVTGGDGVRAGAGEVLRLADVIGVGRDFTPAELDRARIAAERDPRLRIALESGYGLTQSLAGIPLLMARWRDAETADPYARAVLTAAVDVTRLGAQAPLSADLLQAAAPGYCSAQQLAEAPAGWFERALAYATLALAGGLALLRPARADLGQSTGYVVADYLVQQVSSERGDAPVPVSTWEAIVSYVRDPKDAVRLGDSAASRQLRDQAAALYRYAANAGDERAALRLTSLERGCHAIVWTSSPRERTTVREWLEDQGLNPRVVWGNSEMTSFELNEPSKSRTEAIFRKRYPELLFKVVPSTEPDVLLQQITVTDSGEQSLTVPAVPLQLTVQELAEEAARLHPAAASTVNSRPSTATVRGAGDRRRVAPGATLLESGIGTGDRVKVENLKFAPIRVVFMAANPGRSDLSGFTPEHAVRFSQEIDRIKRTARLGHIQLVGEFPRATRDILPDVISLKPDIIHLSCAGAGNRLILEDNNGEADLVSPEWFADALAARHRSYLSGIVLSGCPGETIAPALLEAARTVVAFLHGIPEIRAVSFTEHFYDELSLVPNIASAAYSAADRSEARYDLMILPPGYADA